MSAQTPVRGTRRDITFAKIDDALADVENIARAADSGRVRCLGTWSAGQILDHLATWVDYAYDGTPLHPPLLIRLMLRPMKGRFLYKKMRAGGKIPGVAGGTLATSPASLDEGLGHFRKSFTKLRPGPDCAARGFRPAHAR